MCSCSNSDLLNYGCQCGGFASEELHIWFNGSIYMIARDANHASQLSKKELSSLPNFSADWVVGDGQGWRAFPDDEILTFGFMDSSQYALTAKNWTQMYTPGFLASI